MFILSVSVSVSPESFNNRDADYPLRISLSCTWLLSKIYSLSDRGTTVILGSFNTGAYFYINEGCTSNPSITVLNIKDDIKEHFIYISMLLH